MVGRKPPSDKAWAHSPGPIGPVGHLRAAGGWPKVAVEVTMDPNKTRRHLENLRAQLEARLSRIDRHLHHRDEPLPADSNERAIELEGREILEGLDDGAALELTHIDHALARLDAGTYGRCDACGKPIAAARLEALPWATACIGCAAAAERSGDR